MEQWTQSFMYHIFPIKEKWFFFARTLRSRARGIMCPPLTCYNIIKKRNVGGLPARQNGIDIALNTIVPAPDLQQWNKFYIAIHWEKDVFWLAS